MVVSMEILLVRSYSREDWREMKLAPGTDRGLINLAQVISKYTMVCQSTLLALSALPGF